MLFLFLFCKGDTDFTLLFLFLTVLNTYFYGILLNIYYFSYFDSLGDIETNRFYRKRFFSDDVVYGLERSNDLLDILYIPFKINQQKHKKNTFFISLAHDK